MNGIRMNQSVAPTSFITSISRRRAKIAVRIVFQMSSTFGPLLRVLEKLLAATSADSAAPLGTCISAAYASALQPHHAWVTQSVIVRALKFSPTREQFYGKLGADKAAAEQSVRDLLAVYSPPLAALQAFMLAEGLEKPDV